MNNQDTYKDLCLKHPEIPIFMQYWWIDIASKGKWDVIYAKINDEIAGFFVYSYQEKFGKKIITNYPLTQYAGPFVFYPEGLNKSEIYSFENKIYSSIIEQLDSKNIDFIEINCHYSFKNWQHFFWNGYKQTTKYTYVLRDISNRDALLKDMSYSQRRRKIKNNKTEFRVSLELSPEEFYDFYKTNLSLQGKSIFYSKEYFLSLYNVSKNRQQGQILSLYDDNNKLVSAFWVIWDRESAYHMILTQDKNKKFSESTTLLVWETLDFLKNKTKCYDFEGSMIKNVAISNQYYGSEAIPYHCISKSNSILMSAWKKYQEWKNQENIKKTSLKK